MDEQAETGHRHRARQMSRKSRLAYWKPPEGQQRGQNSGQEFYDKAARVEEFQLNVIEIIQISGTCQYRIRIALDGPEVEFKKEVLMRGLMNRSHGRELKIIEGKEFIEVTTSRHKQFFATNGGLRKILPKARICWNMPNEKDELRGIGIFTAVMEGPGIRSKDHSCITITLPPGEEGERASRVLKEKVFTGNKFVCSKGNGQISFAGKIKALRAATHSSEEIRFRFE